MRKTLIFYEHPKKKFQSSVYRNIKRDGAITIAPENLIINQTRGFHLSEEDLMNMIHNIPEKYKEAIRTIKDNSEIEPYSKGVKVMATIKPAVDVVKKTLQDLVSTPDLLDFDYEKMTKDEQHEYLLALKKYAETVGIKIHPATKNIASIIQKLKG